MPSTSANVGWASASYILRLIFVHLEEGMRGFCWSRRCGRCHGEHMNHFQTSAQPQPVAAHPSYGHPAPALQSAGPVLNPLAADAAEIHHMPRVTPAPLVAERLELYYGKGDNSTHALRGVDFAVGQHGPEAVAVMGPSGSGKSSLLHVLAGILTPTNGSIMWRGSDIATMKDASRTRLRRSDFGFVFQSGQLLPELSAAENVMIPMLLARTPRAEAQRRAQGMLHALGLGGMFDKRPGQLSGGQAQRVAIARALVTGPGLVFADEPTGALDQATGASVLQLLTHQTLSRGASLVVVTHDPAVARACTRTVRLEDGIIVSDARHDQSAPQATGAGR